MIGIIVGTGCQSGAKRPDQSVGLRRSARACPARYGTLSRRAFELLRERCDQFSFRARSGLEALWEWRASSACLGRSAGEALAKPIESGVTVETTRCGAISAAPAGRAAPESGGVDRGRYRIAYSRSAHSSQTRHAADELGCGAWPAIRFSGAYDFPCAESEGDRPALRTENGHTRI